MAGLTVRCTSCGWPVEPDTINRGTLSPCRQCRAMLQVTVFPAMVTQPQQGQQAQRLVMDDEASCFFHQNKRAAVPCDECGRFLCSLCDIQIGSRHVCPSCIQSDGNRAKTKRASVAMETERRTYGSIALLLALLPLWGVTQVISLYYCIWHWRKPPSMIQRTRLRYVLSAIISLMWIAVFAAAFVSILREG